MAIGVDTSELELLQAKLGGLDAKVFLEDVRRAAGFFADAASRNAPVGPTGRLKRGFGEPRIVSTGSGIAAEVPVDPYYARYVEEGTRKMAPRHFIRDAWPVSEREAFGLLVEAFERAMR